MLLIFLIITAIEQQKEIEEDIRIENTDFDLQSVYDPAQFSGYVFRIKKDLTNLPSSATVSTETSTKENGEKEENSILSKKNMSEKDDILKICIAVAEVEGDFRMIPGDSNNIGRNCETELRVLQHGTYQVRTKQCISV